MIDRSLRLLAAALLSISASPPAPVPEPAPVRFAWFDYRGEDVPPGSLRRGEYRNPVLPGFYPDPSVIRVGDSFYLVNSTFAYFPGLPVFRSRDLVHWTQIGNAIDRPSQVDFTGRGLSEGLFAPALHHAGKRFYIVNTCVGCGGNFIISARDPAGPWSDPVWIRDVGGIDPSLFTDTDGTTWLVNNDAPAGGPRWEGHRAIWQRRFDLATLKTAGPARMIVDGGIDRATRPVWVEGPHLFRHDGRYYLIAAEGGTGPEHSETVYRADLPDGPFVPFPRPILTQRDLNPARPDPITSAGHAQLVDAGKAGWWATFLATRPYRVDDYNTGRETFLMPVTWRDGWPVITQPGQAIPRVARSPAIPTGAAGRGDPDGRERFAGAVLAPHWLMVRTPTQRWWRTGAGGLSITPRRVRIGETGQPGFIARRQQHLRAVVSTEVTAAPLAPPGAKAGLVAYQNEAHYYFVGLASEGGRRLVRVERRADARDPVDGVVLASTAAPAGAVRLRIVARGGVYDFDYAAADGKWMRLLADADGSILSTRAGGGFVGATIGMYAYAP